MLTLRLILILTAALQLTPHATSSRDIINSQTAPKTVQVSVSANADVLIENAEGKRIGVDPRTGKFVNEIPDARLIDGAGMAPFMLPYDKSGKPYTIMVTGKSEITFPADLSMTGPGFVVGVRLLSIRSGLIHTVTISPNGSTVSLTASNDGEMPRLFMTTQSDRTKPSYRFEVGATSLSRGKTFSLELKSAEGRLYVKSTETKQLNFTVQMRRTNPSGTRDTFSHRDIPFDGANSYSIDFGNWDGKGDIQFCRANSSDEGRCTALKNEAPAKQPN